MDKVAVSSSIEYRTIQDGELDQIAAVFTKAFKFHVDEEAYRKRFKGSDEPDLSTQFVAVHDGKIIAGVRADCKPLSFHDDEGNVITRECGEINDVSTLPDYRRLGISKRLLEMALRHVKEKRYALAVLQADPKYFAKNLYESKGFQTLRSTAELYFARLGSAKTCWTYYPFFSIIFPILPWLARRLAPQPPPLCLDHLEPVLHGKKEPGGKRGASRGRIIQVTGPVSSTDLWIPSWRKGISDALPSIQGMHEHYEKIILLQHKRNEPLTGRVLEHYSKNKVFQSFVQGGGRKHNFILMCNGEAGTSRQASETIDGRDIIGGLKYSVEFMQQGRLKAVIPMIDTAWVNHQYRGNGNGALLLWKAAIAMGKHFPFVIAKTSSGNVSYVKALVGAGFTQVASGITMVKPIADQELFERLASRVEPWIF